MIAVDTNVLLRVLVDDPAAPEQCEAARRVVSSAGRVIISAAVFLETIWTLARVFHFSRKQVAHAADQLLHHPKYRVQDSNLFAAAVARFAQSNVDFADATALEHAARSGVVLHTFDRKLARLEGAHAVASGA